MPQPTRGELAVSKKNILEGETVLVGLQTCDAKLPDDLKTSVYEAKLKEASESLRRLEDAKRAYYEQTDIVERNLADLNTLSVRVRSAVKGIYGADSAEYKSVPATRKSAWLMTGPLTSGPTATCFSTSTPCVSKRRRNLSSSGDPTPAS
ncbi:MAG: hypothetical protein AUK47_24610 [Deltaproteobacteria bacterium CG2_30_63_29]|nr:MAG: hypothetical protein AUK47_24610 [Deltaproteobacteria bacterium CG2_30_63_29]